MFHLSSFSFKLFAAAFGEVEIDISTICNCECQDEKVKMMLLTNGALFNAERLVDFHQ